MTDPCNEDNVFYTPCKCGTTACGIAGANYYCVDKTCYPECVSSPTSAVRATCYTNSYVVQVGSIYDGTNVYPPCTVGEVLGAECACVNIAQLDREPQLCYQGGICQTSTGKPVCIKQCSDTQVNQNMNGIVCYCGNMQCDLSNSQCYVPKLGASGSESYPQTAQMNGSAIGALCLPLCYIGVQARATCLCKVNAVYNVVYTGNNCYTGKVVCANGGIGTCSVGSTTCARGTVYNAKTATCEQQTTPCTTLSTFPDTAETCKCVDANSVLSADRTCHKYGTYMEYYYKCPYNRVLSTITLYSNDIFDETCLCKNTTTRAGVYAGLDMICKPDGTVVCKAGMHFVADGSCKPNCSITGSTRDDQPGVVYSACYCGTSNAECSVGSYCVGSASTTSAGAQCISVCDSKKVNYGNCLCTTQEGDDAYATTDAICNATVCSYLGATDIIPALTAKCGAYCYHSGVSDVIAPAGGCGCQVIGYYPYFGSSYLYEGGICYGGTTQTPATVLVQPCSVVTVATDKCHCGNSYLVVEKQKCIPDATGSYISADAHANCMAGDAADQTVCGNYHLCTKQTTGSDFVCKACSNGQRVHNDGGTYSCVPVCDNDRALTQTCLCIDGATVNKCTYDAASYQYCYAGTCQSIYNCTDNGVASTPCLCGGAECYIGATCVLSGSGADEKRECVCPSNKTILYNSAAGCICGTSVCGAGVAKEVCAVLSDSSVSPADAPVCVAACDDASASGTESRCACASRRLGLPAPTLTEVIERGELCDATGVPSHECAEGAAFVTVPSSSTYVGLTQCSCGGFGVVCGAGKFCNSTAGVCVDSLSACVAGDAPVESPGCDNTGTACSAGNVFTGGKCVCASNYVLGASKCECGTNVNAGEGGVCVESAGIATFYPRCARSETSPVPVACACVSGAVYTIVAANGICRIDGETVPPCTVDQMTTAACNCVAGAGISGICASGAFCDSSAADLTALCVPACTALQMGVSDANAAMICTCGAQMCDIGAGSGKQCYNVMSNYEGGSNGSVCVDYTAGDPYGSATPTPVAGNTVKCGEAGLCNAGSTCIAGVDPVAQDTCTNTGNIGPCTGCGTATCTEFQKCVGSVCQATTCTDGAQGPCTGCGTTSPVNCKHNQLCDMAAAKCVTIEDQCNCADMGIGPCKCGTLTCKEGQMCNIGTTSTVPATATYSCTTPLDMCSVSRYSDKLPAIANTCRCGATASCLTYLGQACVSDKCVKRCQPGVVRSACACAKEVSGSDATARLATKGQTCTATGDVICSEDRLNEAYCDCSGVTCNSGSTCKIELGVGICTSVYCTSGKQGTTLVGATTFDCQCGTQAAICSGSSACVGGVNTRSATSQCFSVCGEASAGTAGCACSSAVLTDLSSICYDDDYCTAMSGTQYAPVMRAESKCLPACGFGKCTVECRCSSDPTKKSCAAGQHCVLQKLDPTASDPQYPVMNSELPRENYVSVAECTASMKDTQICACGPGDWAHGNYYAMYKKDCSRCSVDTIARAECSCKSGAASAMAQCTAGKACVANPQKGVADYTDELCLDLCVNSDTQIVATECACAAAESHLPGAAALAAPSGALCKADGSVLETCLAPITKPCYCGGNTCIAGQTCSSGTCNNPSATCTSNTVVMPDTACMCGTTSCYIGYKTICFKENTEYACLPICTDQSALDDCACKVGTGYYRAPPSALCDATGIISGCPLQQVNSGPKCWCDPNYGTYDVLEKTETTTYTENVACFKLKALPMCYNHNAMPQPRDCACGPSYDTGARISYVAKGGLCKFDGSAKCTTSDSCADGMFCSADGTCTDCKELFDGCSSCVSAAECLTYTVCTGNGFYVSGGKCLKCEGTVSNGACRLGNGLGVGAIVGIAIGSVAFCALVGVGIWLIIRHIRNKKIFAAAAKNK